jgi:Bax protein
MKNYTVILAVLVVGLVIELGRDHAVISVNDDDASVHLMPDFTEFVVVEERKQAFTDFILPIIQQHNEQLLEQRQWLQALELDRLSADELSYWRAMAEHYHEPMPLYDDLANWRQAMLVKLDTIPVSLALSQAAKESGWGQSRFAQQGNNLFGQWCFTEGCGLVPLARPSGQSHEVRVFDSPDEAVAAYMHNLNTSHFYNEFRQHRAEMRQLQDTLDGYLLAQGLGAYSIRGSAYIADIQSMIQFNGWLAYDQ